MSAVALVLLLAAAFALAWLLTAWLRTYALRRSLIDRPNARSAHSVDTPRGGGASFVVAFTAGLLVSAMLGKVPYDVTVALSGAGAIVAVVGFWDDHGHVSARWRLLAHFAAAAWLLAWLPAPSPQLQDWVSGAMPLLYIVAAVLIAWLVNLYNFMDGIDGIAAAQAITSAGGAALVAVLGGHSQFVLPNVLLCAAVAGFLVWNWPPARIFMGDVGSGFVGLVLGGLAAWAGMVSADFLVSWAILLAVFIVDSGVTLARRALRGERVYQAHRMHAYQHAARRFGSHAPVTAAVAVINVLWLLPIAVLAEFGMIGPVIALALAYVPLVVAALWWKAGLPEKRGAPAA